MLLNTKVKRWDGACIYVRAGPGSLSLLSCCLSYGWCGLHTCDHM